jgi:hypothetical protein
MIYHRLCHKLGREAQSRPEIRHFPHFIENRLSYISYSKKFLLPKLPSWSFSPLLNEQRAMALLNGGDMGNGELGVRGVGFVVGPI